MATSKTSAKAATGKPVPKASTVTTTKARTVITGKPAVKPEPAAKTKAPAKAAPKKVVKAAPKAAPKIAAAKPAASRAKKPAGIAAEQRRNYIEVAAYHIAERRGFAPGNTLDDWVQAEAEIDRLLAEGLLGR